MKNNIMSLFSQDIKIIPNKRLRNNVVSYCHLNSFFQEISLLHFLNTIKTAVIRFLKETSENKVQLNLICNMMKVDPATEDVRTKDNVSFNTKQESEFGSTDLKTMYSRATTKILETFIFNLPKKRKWVDT